MVACETIPLYLGIALTVFLATVVAVLIVFAIGFYRECFR